MKKTTITGFIEQADARMNNELSRIPSVPGEIPDVEIGETAGRALDFLKRNGVPVRGYEVDMHIYLTLGPVGAETVKEEVLFQPSFSHEKRRGVLRSAIGRFKKAHGNAPFQHTVHKIRFLLDESKIEE